MFQAIPALLAMTTAAAPPVTVSDLPSLRKAVAEAGPGTTILIAPGVYSGGVTAVGLRGEPGASVVIRGADPKRPPVFQGGSFAIQLSSPAHVELRDVVVSGMTGNGINIDDGGNLEKPARHVVLRGLVVRDIGPKGNHDGIKLSGVDDFRVEGCVLERWGEGGSGVDMVGCHRGEIVDSVFRHGDAVGGNGVQAKGGCRDVAVRRCRFEHAGQRAVNLGGSTGLPYFRPRPVEYEAKDLTVEDSVFIGSQAAVGFVGVDGAVVRHNTIYRPTKWAFRILQETREPGFVPCRRGRITENLIVYRSDEMTVPVNVGDATAPETFTLAGNVWHCLDQPSRSRPRLPIPETDGRYDVAPRFRDAEKGDFTRGADDPTAPAGDRPPSK